MKDRFGTPIKRGSIILYPGGPHDEDSYDSMCIHKYEVLEVLHEKEKPVYAYQPNWCQIGTRVDCEFRARCIEPDGTYGTRIVKLERGAQAIVIDNIIFNVENPDNIDMRIRK